MTVTEQRAESSSVGRQIRPVSEVPGPPGPRLAHQLAGVLWPVATRRAMLRRYGPLFRTGDLIAGRVVHVADRELVEQIFKWRPADYTVAEPRRVMEQVLGSSSVLLLDGEPHLRMRRLMLPPFHGDAIEHFRDLIAEITDREIDRWRPGQRVRTRTVAQAITLEVIIRAVFGIRDPARLAEMRALLPGLSAVNPLLLFAQRDLGPHSPWGRFLRRRERVDEMIYEEIDLRRASGDDPTDDILSLLLAARDPDGEPLSDRELRDQLITLLLAGHETTATSIGWAFERLLRAPASLARLRAELEAGESEDYLDAVVKETLRVRPVVAEVFRSPAIPVELGGYRFEPGDQLAAALMLIHRDPELYPPDPDAFRPARFLDGAPEPYAWIPFGGGVRRCLGAAFAELEMRVVIARILARARLRSPRPRDERARFRGVTILPSRGGEALVESVLPA